MIRSADDIRKVIESGNQASLYVELEHFPKMDICLKRCYESCMRYKYYIKKRTRSVRWRFISRSCILTPQVYSCSAIEPNHSIKSIQSNYNGILMRAIITGMLGKLESLGIFGLQFRWIVHKTWIIERRLQNVMVKCFWWLDIQEFIVIWIRFLNGTHINILIIYWVGI